MNDFVVIGCGSRGRTYSKIACELGWKLRAIADPSAGALAAVRAIAGDPAPREFCSGEELLAAGRLARLALIATQDAQHFGHARAALIAGYDLLLEKPAARTAEEVVELDRLARELDRQLILCFVLRYTPFYQAAQRAVAEGRMGRLLSIQASEGVGPFHHAHSFVRGHWSKPDESTPMIVQKCCHDTDILAWLAGSRARTVSSFAENTWFRPENALPGAPPRCADGCPHGGRCRYDARRYLSDKRRWLNMVRADGEHMSDAQILEWLRTSDWGRCVYQCDHGTPDHQIVNIHFENGVTASLTMTAFDTGRRLRLFGTEGVLSGAMDADGREPWLEYRPHEGEVQSIALSGGERAGYVGHGGGDYGLISSLAGLLDSGAGKTGDFIEGHRIAFAADASARRGGALVGEGA